MKKMKDKGLKEKKGTCETIEKKTTKESREDNEKNKEKLMTNDETKNIERIFSFNIFCFIKKTSKEKLKQKQTKGKQETK